jgi:3-hydroxyacyl-CoA dehydrogenase/enoyl-CoA hydratase/3-hydroxybutyryl-CoA epimerase
LEQQIRTALHRDGVLVATIDMPGRRMNVFSEALMDSLDALMARVESDDAVHGVVLTSGKTTFLAGADLAMVSGFTEAAHALDEEAMTALCGRLGRQFVRLEGSAKPWVAAINGIALGGGLELAMACRERIVADDPRVQLGLPEVRWGLLPGAGGTQRLPRLVGFRPGLDLLLSGRSISPPDAVRLGIASQAVDASELLTVARKRALGLCGTPYDPARKFRYYAQVDVPDAAAGRAQELARSFGISDESYRDYPAYAAIVNCVLLGARTSLDEASGIEMRQFIGLMADPVAGNMVRTLFLDRQRADKELAADAGLTIRRVQCGRVSASWRDALLNSGLPFASDMMLDDGTIGLEDSSHAVHSVRVEELGASTMDSSAQAVLSPRGEYGRVLEIVGLDKPIVAALTALAKHIRALPWPTLGKRSALAELAQCVSASMTPDSLDAQAIAALRQFARGDVADPVFLNVAACAAGVSPAYTGGPLTYLAQRRERLVARLSDDLRDAWVRAASLLKAVPP